MKILIVDDSSSWRTANLNVAKFVYNDAEIITAESGDDGYFTALQHLKEPFDIIVSDLQMELSHEPEHAGEWFVRQVQMQKEYKDTKFILVSASYDIRFIAYKLNVEYVPKRSMPDGLMDKLEEIKKFS